MDSAQHAIGWRKKNPKQFHRYDITLWWRGDAAALGYCLKLVMECYAALFYGILGESLSWSESAQMYMAFAHGHMIIIIIIIENWQPLLFPSKLLLSRLQYASGVGCIRHAERNLNDSKSPSKIAKLSVQRLHTAVVWNMFTRVMLEDNSLVPVLYFIVSDC